ncbi:MAG: hypothetical protein ACXWV0_09785, partial [Flavisolibacter sp.]
MQFKQSLQPLRGLFKITVLAFLLSPGKAGAQTTYLPQDARENVLLERMQIKKQNNPVLNFSTARPFSRQHVVPVVENEFFPFFKQLAPSLPLSIPYREDTLQVNSDTALQAYYKKSGYSKVDYHNARQLLMNSSEWASRNFSSRKKFLNHFYKSPGHFYEVNTKDFFLSLNPVFQYYVGKEQDNDQHIFLNTRGITLRGRIGNKIGFAAYMTDNQERTPLYVQRFVTDR